MDTYRLMGGKRRCEQRRENYKNIVQAARLTGSPLLAPPSRETIGDFTGLCLLIEFSDDPATIPQTEVDEK